jgi:hypothetical protein
MYEFVIFQDKRRRTGFGFEITPKTVYVKLRFHPDKFL